MLTTRSVIVAIVAAAILSVVSALVSLLWVGPTHSVIGKDSYGTRTEGYRAVYDLLEAFDFETERVLIPEAPEQLADSTYVLWHPRDRVVQTEPAYLKKLSEWVRAGGYLVVTPSTKPEDFDASKCRTCSQKNCSTCTPVSLFVELGLPEVAAKEVELKSQAANRKVGQTQTETLREAVRDIFRAKKRPSTVYTITSEGEWEYLNKLATQVELPAAEAWEIDYGQLQPSARITIDNEQRDSPSTFAALFQLGKGRVALVSNPYLASNANLLEVDNSVVLTHLLTASRSRVIFDEFYHGLTVRGNALWLLTKLPYAAITCAILLVVGLWIWRQAIFLGPSREEKETSRRSLGEYLEAMSRFLLKGRESSRYILQELRDGTLWHFSKLLGLPPQQQNADIVLGLLSRREPEKATQLQEALQHADAVLGNPHAPKNEILLATRKVSDCLST